MIPELTTRPAVDAAENERLFSSTMIESMPGVLYFYDHEGRFLRWNRNFEIVTGYTGEEVAHMHPLDFFREGEKAFVAHRIAEVMEKGISSVEAGLLAKDGTVTPYFFTGRRVVFDGQACLVGMGSDISERLAAEHALMESEQKLRVLFDQAPLGIALIDSSSGSYLKVNAQFCHITGHTEEELLRLCINRITHPDDLAADREHMQRLAQGQIPAFQIQKRYIRGDWLDGLGPPHRRLALAGGRTLGGSTSP